MDTHHTHSDQWQHGMDAVYLASCALRGECPQWDGEKDLEGLFAFCRLHTITAIVAMALESFWKEHPAQPEVMKPWKQAKEMAIRKNILLNAERESIIRYMESIGCWYLQMKGSLLQHDYPKFGMRQMTDNDILFDESKRDLIHTRMEGNGFKTVRFRQGKVDIYQKPPVYNFEMHTELFEEEEMSEMAGYFENVKERLVQNTGSEFGYHMTCEDFYIYMIAHAYKHFINGGIGVRNLLDSYVFLEKHEEKLDWDYVGRELTKLGAAEFERECAFLCRKIFGGVPGSYELTVREEKLLDLFFTSGTFGTSDQQLEKKMQRLQGSEGKITAVAKWKYIWRRLFPPMSAFLMDYPDIEQNKWKLPFIQIWRFFKMIFIKPVSVVKELNRIRKAKHSDSDRV